MKRLVYFVGALAMIGFAVLLQLDVTSLYRLVVSGVNEAPIGMYVLWLFPTLLNIDYAVLGDNTFWILLISDVLLIGGLLVTYAGIRYDDTANRGYHY